jgi:hypothetical protein
MQKRSVCSIITKNYLAYARTLAQTLNDHNPNIDLHILLADQIDEPFNLNKELFKLIELRDLSCQDSISKMCFYYNSFEFCNSLKGLLHQYMFEKTTYQSWLFLDSDIMIYDSLNSIFEKLEKNSILLCPHNQEQANNNFIEYEVCFLRGGVYNGGFLGINRTNDSKDFINWFSKRLIYYAFDDLSIKDSRGFFVDQLWLNLVPLYFKNVAFLTEAGANLGHWNLFERKLKKKDNKIFVDGSPLVFAHFSGLDFSDSSKISKYAIGYPEQAFIIWMELTEDYKNRLLKNDFELTINYTYKFNRFDNKKLIQPQMRRTYYNDLLNQNEKIENPFQNYRYFLKNLSTERYNRIKFFFQTKILNKIIQKLDKIFKNS